MSNGPAPREPLGPVTSIKVKLGLLVAASVLVAAVLATLGAGAVPAWLSIPVTVLLALGGDPAAGGRDDLAAAADDRGGAADGGRRLRRTRRRRPRPTRWASWPAPSTRCPPTWRPSTGSAATSSPASPTSCGRRSTALVAVLENLDDGVIAPDPRGRRTSPAAQAERLSDLVDDLLDLSRLDAGVVPLDRQRQPVAALLESVVAEARSGPGRQPARRDLRRARRAPRPDDVRRPRPPAPAAGQPARQRGPAQPGRRRRLRLGRSRRRAHPDRGRRRGTGHRARGPRAGLRTVRHAAGLHGRRHRSRAGDRALGDRPARRPDRGRRPRARGRPVPASASSCPARTSREDTCP